MIIHIFALGVPAIVAPLGNRLLGRSGRAAVCVVAAAVAAPTFAFHRGLLAAVWVVPWVGLAVGFAAADCFGGEHDRSRFPIVAASAFLAVSATALLASRLGVSLGRVAEPIVELTAVHYGVAGYGATLLAWCAAAAAPHTHHRIATVALTATMVAPPVVAAGFLTGGALPQVGGAVLLSVGVLSTALLTGVDARSRGRDNVTRVLLAVCALAPVAPMALAVAWAAAQHWVFPALDIPSMARVHGAMNFIGFVCCGLVGYARLRTPAEVASCS